MWTEKSVEETKREIKNYLDEVESQGGTDERNRVIQECISKLEKSADSEGLLKLYVYLVSALVLHIRLKNLSPARVKKILSFASSILFAQGIKENTSRLSFLHGELHSVWSQIAWQSGNHWQAAWQQFLGYQVTRGAHLREPGFQNLTMANRALRLGHIESALEGFEKAKDQVDGIRLDHCLANIVRAYRLANKRDKAKELLEGILSREDISDRLRTEVLWEKLINQYLDDQDLVPLLKSIKKNQIHYNTSYIIEVCVWAMIHPSKSWLARIPSLDNLKRKADLKPDRGDVFYESAKAIHDCYDTDIPLHRRLDHLGEKLSIQNKQINIDKELLIWAAATRWLWRSRNDVLSKITYKEYQALSHKLSSGRSDDLLCLGKEQDS